MPLSQQDKRIALALLIAVSSVYFAAATGITSSNDGSHYALVRALVERGSFEISPYLDFTEHQDYALNGDRRFSDRPPGTALIAAVFYGIGTFAPDPITLPPSKHDPDNPRMIYALMASALMMSAGVTLFYLTLRRYLGVSTTAALLAAIGLAFGTACWKYGSLLYSHSAAILVVWGVLYLTLKAEYEGSLRWRWAFTLGFGLGFAPLTEYTSALFTALVGIYLVVVMWEPARAWLADEQVRAGQIHSLIAFAIGGIIPIAFLLIYNTLNFGGPFEISTFNVDFERWPQNEGFAADFATPLLKGLVGVLFYGEEPDMQLFNQGMFLLSPLTVLALPGLGRFFRHSRRHFILIIGVFTVYLLLFSKSTTYNPYTHDSRYLTTFIGLWFVPLAFWLDRYFEGAGNTVKYLLWSLLVFGLLFISIRNQIMHIAFSWNHDLDPAQLRPFATTPDNLRTIFGAVFRNVPNLPILWGGEALAIGFVWLIRRRRDKFRRVRAGDL